MSSDDFLSRWSRRKLETRREAQAPPAEPLAPAEVPAEAPGEAEPELTPEEVAALPPLEELTAESDISAFLRRGVPELLKKAALRRVWSLDPAIRDYVSEAREYAYDWNVPGGVPGNGPMLATDNIPEMLRGIFGDSDPLAGENPLVASAMDPVRPSSSARPGRASDPGGVAADQGGSAEEVSASEDTAAAAGPSPEEQVPGSLIEGDAVTLSHRTSVGDQLKTEEIPPLATPPRRHGKAKPV